MATPITINVQNNSNVIQNFFFFQQPAIYSGGPEVYTNSLYTAPVLPYASSGSSLSFSLLLQFYAGAQQQLQPPTVGQPSGTLSAIQPIDLTPATGGQPTKNTTTMVVSPSLGLSPATNTVGPQAGSFRIATPTFNPNLQKYNAGSAIQRIGGGITLSNFVTVQPSNYLDCQPVLKFYVATGTYVPGTVMNFTSSSISAAECDFTPGYSTYQVIYNADGTWTSTPFALLSNEAGKKSLVDAAAVVRVAIMNEAGTGVISYGQTHDLAPPLAVENLTNPGGLQLFSEYQVGPAGGPFEGLMCTSVHQNRATFA